MCQPHTGESTRGNGRSIEVTFGSNGLMFDEQEATRGKLIKVLYSAEF